MSKTTKKSLASKFGKQETLQAIVFADDFTHNLAPLQDVYPSIMIPLITSPLLDYLIATLIRSRVQEVFLYCSSHVEILKNYVKSTQSRCSDDITITLVISDGCRSLGDALRDIDTKGWIRGCFILIRGDTFTNIDLKGFAEIHRARIEKDKNAALTMVLADLGNIGDSSLKDESSILVSNASNKKVLFYKKFENNEKKVPLELQWFLDHDKIQIKSSLLDSHVYFCSPSVLLLFAENFDFQTMEDFIRGVLMNEEILDSRIYWEAIKSKDYAIPVTSWKAYHTISRDILQRRSYPLVPDTLPFMKHFVYMPKSTYKHRTAALARGCTIERDSLLGENSALGKNSYITRSIIGANCTIGDNVCIENSYLLSDVIVQNNCVIKNSVILQKCTVEQDANIDGCILSSNVNVKSRSVMSDSILEVKNGLLISTNMSEQYHESDSRFLFFSCRENHSDSLSTDSDVLSSNGQSKAESLPDDANMFLSEVIDSLLRGYQDKVKCENLILEINSSRYAYNVNIREVAYNVIKAILSLPLHHLSDTKNVISTASYSKTLEVMLNFFQPIISNYIKTEDAQEDCLRAIEDVGCATEEFLPFAPRLLHRWYNDDILLEEKILEWHESDKEEEIVVKKAVLSFIKWLNEAEEEDSE